MIKLDSVSEKEGQGLKPCPFCGGNAEIEYGYCDYNVYQVVCQNRECNTYVGWCDTPEEAAEVWNRRVENA